MPSVVMLSHPCGLDNGLFCGRSHVGFFHSPFQKAEREGEEDEVKGENFKDLQLWVWHSQWWAYFVVVSILPFPTTHGLQFDFITHVYQKDHGGTYAYQEDHGCMHLYNNERILNVLGSLYMSIFSYLLSTSGSSWSFYGNIMACYNLQLHPCNVGQVVFRDKATHIACL